MTTTYSIIWGMGVVIVALDMTVSVMGQTTCSRNHFYVITCPQLGQPDDYTSCCYRNHIPSCCSSRLFGAIFGGVFGSVILILSIIGIVCCVKIKQGKWVCVRVGPGRKYQVMTRAKMNAYVARRNIAIQQLQQQALQGVHVQGLQPGVNIGGQTAYWNPSMGAALDQGPPQTYGNAGNQTEAPPSYSSATANDLHGKY